MWSYSFLSPKLDTVRKVSLKFYRCIIHMPQHHQKASASVQKCAVHHNRKKQLHHEVIASGVCELHMHLY